MMKATRLYRWGNALLRAVLFPVALDLQVEGLEHIPPTGPLIIAINHTSFIDPLLVGAYVRRPVAMMSKIENFQLPMLGHLVRWYGAFPIQRGEVDREALKKALEALRQGDPLLMAPEGTRSADGQLQAGHDGLALIATRTRAPVVPFVIAGARPVSKNVTRLRRTRVRVKVGEAYVMEPSTPKPDRAELARLTEQLMLRFAALLPPEQRGIYRERVP